MTITIQIEKIRRTVDGQTVLLKPRAREGGLRRLKLVRADVHGATNDAWVALRKWNVSFSYTFFAFHSITRNAAMKTDICVYEMPDLRCWTEWARPGHPEEDRADKAPVAQKSALRLRTVPAYGTSAQLGGAKSKGSPGGMLGSRRTSLNRQTTA